MIMKLLASDLGGRDGISGRTNPRSRCFHSWNRPFYSRYCPL